MIKLICLLLLISTYAFAGETSDILSRLFKKNTRNANPLVLVLDRNTLRPVKSFSNRAHSYEKTSYNYDVSDEGDDSLRYIMHQLDQLLKSQKSHPISHHHHRAVSHSAHQDRLLDKDSLQDKHQARHQERYHRNEFQGRIQNIKNTQAVPSRLNKKESKVKSVLRSPVYKSLLTVRNSLWCGARLECRNECEDNYRGEKKDSCEVECEEKFECDEPKNECKDTDECNNSEDECAESGENQCQGSTKGFTSATARNRILRGAK